MNVSLAAGCTVALLLAGQPAGAVMMQGDAAARVTQPAGSAAAAAAAAAAAVNREGFVQALDVAAQTIVINSTRYVIGAPQLALQDKRPKSDGLLTLAGVKIGMLVRYRVAKTDGGDRVVELWIIRDPQQTLGTRP